MEKLAKRFYRDRLLEKFPNFHGQDERGIWTAPSGAKVAWFKDPDENLLSISQA